MHLQNRVQCRCFGVGVNYFLFFYTGPVSRRSMLRRFFDCRFAYSLREYGFAAGLFARQRRATARLYSLNTPGILLIANAFGGVVNNATKSVGSATRIESGMQKKLKKILTDVG